MTIDTTATRQPTLAERFSPVRDDLERYVTAIARRNNAYHYLREAADLLEARQLDVLSGARQLDLRPYVQNYNDAAHDYERASYDLVRAQVRWQTEGTPWT